MADTCTELDADMAGAYLEGALTGTARGRFEAHLSGCRDCRGHLIELSRLGQAVPAAELPVWDRLQAAAAGHLARLEVALAGWNWTMAGGAMAACAVLAAVLVIQPWKSPHPVDSLETNIAATGIEPAPVRPIADPAPGQALTSEAVTAQNPRSRIPSPRIDLMPIRGSQPGAGMFAGDAARNLPPVPNTQSIQPPVVARPAEEFIPSRASSQSLSASPIAFSDERPAAEAAPSRPETSPRINPQPDFNPMRSVSNSNRRSVARERNDRSTARGSRPGWSDRVMGFMPIGRSESSKTADEESDPDQLVPMTRKVRDKTFSYENGVWIDQAYKPDLMSWRMVRIQSGSREYDRLISEDPQIREFLNLGQLIIVWHDKIYKIVNR